MKKMCILILSCLFFTAIMSNALATEPANLALLKKQIVQYVKSGEYFNDIQQQINKAEIYLQQKIAMNKISKQKKKLAIVFDIDETSITSFKHMHDNDFGAVPKVVIEQNKGTHSPAIPATLSLYRFAQKNNIAIFFITGRGENVRTSTTKELHNAGYSKWAHLYMCHTTTTHCDAIPFKSKTRKEIMAKGYDIVLNVGDQFSDLKGGYADYMVKLPNPFYYVP